MTDIDRTAWHVESLVLLFLMVMYGLDRYRFEDAVVMMLFVIAVLLLRMTYYQRSD